MGLFDRLRGTAQGQKDAPEETKGIMPNAGVIAQVRSVLAPKKTPLQQVTEMLLPHEKPVDILKLIQNQENKKEIKEEFGSNKTTYVLAVLPSQYDDPRYNDPKYGTNPDVWFDGDSYHSKRREEIVSSNVSVKEPESSDFKPYYERQRYFVEVDGKLLPKASIYAFANGQVQIHSCDYDTKGRVNHFRNVIDGNLIAEATREYADDGHVSKFVEKDFNEKGELIRSNTFTATFIKDGFGPGKDCWVENRVVGQRDSAGTWTETPVEQFSRKENVKDLYMNTWELRLRRLAVPHPQDTVKEPYIGKPGYGV